MAIVRNLMVRAGADFSGMRREMQRAQQNISSFKENISRTVKGIGAVLATVGAGMGLSSAIKDAMDVEAALQQVNRMMGDSAQTYIDWANTNAASFGMAKSEAIKYGAVYANLISGFSSGTKETMQRTQDLIKASSIIASATGRSMDDVMERIRSGLLGNTEAIEDLGVNVNVAMLESTNAFAQFANGKHWEQLDFQTQQQIRLMAILEQTNTKYGSSLNQNTATNMAMFVAQLNNIKLALGQAFLPILNTVLPVLTAFAQRVAWVMGIVAQFTAALFGKNISQQKAQTQATQQQAAAVGNLGNAIKKTGKEATKTGEAAKKASGSLAGFDEINQLADNSSSGSSGSGGGAGAADVGTGGIGTGGLPAGGGINFDTNAPEISKKVQDMANKVKQIIKDVVSFITENKATIISVISGILAGIASFMIISKWANIVKYFNLAIEGIGAAFAGISWPIVAIAAAIAFLVANIVYLWQTNSKFRDSVIQVWQQIKDFVSSVVSDMWSIVKSTWDKYGADITKGVQGFLQSIQSFILMLWEDWLKPIFTSGFQVLKDLWDNHLKGFVAQFMDFMAKVIDAVLLIWNFAFKPLINYLGVLGQIFGAVFHVVAVVVGDAFGYIADIAKGLFKALGGIIDFLVGVFTGNWSRAWGGIKDIFRGIFDSLSAIARAPLNMIIDMINAVIDGFNKIDIKIPDWSPVNPGKTYGIHIPHIPKLAEGGITNGPTMALIGDNPGGQEVVSPLAKLNDIIAGSVGNAVMQAMKLGKSGTGGDIVLNLDGRTFARVIKPWMDMENKRVGTNVRLQSI